MSSPSPLIDIHYAGDRSQWFSIEARDMQMAIANDIIWRPTGVDWRLGTGEINENAVRPILAIVKCTLIDDLTADRD